MHAIHMYTLAKVMNMHSTVIFSFVSLQVSKTAKTKQTAFYWAKSLTEILLLNYNFLCNT